MKNLQRFAAEIIPMRTSYREVFKQLERGILSGQFSPGDSIPTEAQLCEMFGVQRTSVREGIRLLEETGLVRSNSSRRLVVQTTNMAQTTASAIRSVALHSVTLQEMCEVESELQLFACRLALQNADEAYDEKLRANIEFTRSSLGTLDELVRADTEFHDLLFEGARNMALTIAREPLGILVFATGEFVIKRLEQSAERLLVAHGNVADAIIARARLPDLHAGHPRGGIRGARDRGLRAAPRGPHRLEPREAREAARLPTGQDARRHGRDN